MAAQLEIDIANRIKRPVAYAEWAYHNDRQFRYHAYELEGGPIGARYFQDKGSILWNVIRWNTHVHLGIRDGNILVLAFRGTDFPLTVENWAKIKRWRGLCGNVLTDLSFGTSSIEWDGAASLQDVLVHRGFLIAFNNLRDSNRGTSKSVVTASAERWRHCVPYGAKHAGQMQTSLASQLAHPGLEMHASSTNFEDARYAAIESWRILTQFQPYQTDIRRPFRSGFQLSVRTSECAALLQDTDMWEHRFGYTNRGDNSNFLRRTPLT
ncbi:hypothetical protein MRS44_013274 [Fusarium solani]|uniref:uncharacterized protein n=1 Tax=Fusarium solani TaxID=169388 RepID=UPI0032C4177F|nr:hypothetical protein MRS44_013274 [Fusarium solani]